MKELKEAVRALMDEEYERAAERFGEEFNSHMRRMRCLKMKLKKRKVK